MSGLQLSMNHAYLQRIGGSYIEGSWFSCTTIAAAAYVCSYVPRRHCVDTYLGGIVGEYRLRHHALSDNEILAFFHAGEGR